ncbi:MAG: SRPBCC family protein [Solirubrobacterales bacterium]
MIAIESSACIEAPAANVWARLAALEEIQLWSEAVREWRCEGALTRGVGAERTRELAGGVTIRERLLAWEEGRSFSYDGFGIPLVARGLNTWTVHPEGDRTLLRSSVQVELKGGALGRLPEPLASRRIRQITPRTLAAFKHLVEHGDAPAVRHSRLAPAPRVC